MRQLLVTFDDNTDNGDLLDLKRAILAMRHVTAVMPVTEEPRSALSQTKDRLLSRIAGVIDEVLS